MVNLTMYLQGATNWVDSMLPMISMDYSSISVQMFNATLM